MLDTTVSCSSKRFFSLSLKFSSRSASYSFSSAALPLAAVPGDAGAAFAALSAAALVGGRDPDVPVTPAAGVAKGAAFDCLLKLA
eukprot:CAMPEP_0173384706 /NCGR_PEP_ID=MMETSP1356-20130122/7288_1 /TAXON_ID=77927 ORGANISM="Hemiselmis virescens, Strain PCC157" /NCGR_SAMPLE_ID=MMETSP1356 /ASSEMBLY_ACC=CAM_ASM_000847 /LENGTH=84 /DNA_ID=CAMNT_0014340201 /DNA_START=256 /DNA_END=506 /DNA_ORIENTATION=+